jgi:two-component system, OmpR family, phosphate regulon response regulator PhoB
LDLTAQHLRFGGKPVAIGPNEFHLLAHFMEHPDKIFSRRLLIGILGKDHEAIDERTVDVWVGRLRRCLAKYDIPDPLRTVRSRGYVLDSIEIN